MPRPLALTKVQAQVIYDVMVCLYTIGARINLIIPQGDVHIYERENGTIQILADVPESYASQEEFAQAYKLL